LEEQLQNKRKIDVTSQFHRQANIANNSKFIHDQLTKGGKELVKRIGKNMGKHITRLKSRLNDPHLLKQIAIYVVECEQ
jgi:hypothetical protein